MLYYLKPIGLLSMLLLLSFPVVGQQIPQFTEEEREADYTRIWKSDPFVDHWPGSWPDPYRRESIVAEVLRIADIAVIGRFIASAPNGVAPLEYPEDAVLMQFQVDRVLHGTNPGNVIMVRVPKRDFYRPEYDIDLAELYRRNNRRVTGENFSPIVTYFEKQEYNNAAVKLGDSYLVFARKHPVGNYYEFPFQWKRIFSQRQYEAPGFVETVETVSKSEKWQSFNNLIGREKSILMWQENDANERVRKGFWYHSPD